MSKGKGYQHSSGSNQSTSESHLDPTIMNALGQNVANAQAKFGDMQYSPLTGAQIQTYQNPYTQDVVNTTMQNLEKARQGAITQGHATAVGQNAFGGSRTGVLDALTNKDFANTAATTAAGLNSAGYTQALQAAQAENTAQNQFPLLIQQLLNSTYGLYGNPTLNSSQSTGSNSSVGYQGNVSVGGGGGGVPAG